MRIHNGVGWVSNLSVAAGDKVAFMVSAEVDEYSAELVRLIHGDVRTEGTGFKADRLPASFSGTYAGIQQKLVPGSYGRTPTVMRSELAARSQFRCGSCRHVRSNGAFRHCARKAAERRACSRSA